ncbi:sigma-70 family RNA polymerase sigma factor [Microlunatus flavus]|uniref:RNA polymerase sigma-70 factor, ECF subfamily n=1 Tax=Microlunatus flavus TaxID=1036181 RepID=A0A1H9N9K9_9ACTN|nr:sigma-70 family RNA polymerase sigma factor [Microlunatus flavus]SER32491.1 RNA polymerase sigma-70 factor, ECF subfamily [Microlunatus flavus]
MGVEEAPGTAEGLRRLQEQHGAALLGFAQRLTHDPDLARDVVQDALLRAWNHPEVAATDDRSARAWLFTVTRHLVVDRWRSAAHRHERSADEETLARWAPADADASSAVLDQWLIADALRGLSPEHRAVIVAAHYEGRPVAEIARMLGVPPGTVKSRLHYGLRSLRLLLQEKGVTAP